MELEPEMLATETIVPVYFAVEDDELMSIYTQTQTSSSSQGSLSAAEGTGFGLYWRRDFTVMLTPCVENRIDRTRKWSDNAKLIHLVHPFRVILVFLILFLVFFIVLLHTATANGFQMVTSGAQSKAVSDWTITSLEVRLNEHYPKFRRRLFLWW